MLYPCALRTIIIDVIFSLLLESISARYSRMQCESPTTVQTRLSSRRRAVSTAIPEPGSTVRGRSAWLIWSPSSYILPFAPSHFLSMPPQLSTLSSRRTKSRPYRSNIYRYFGCRAQALCNGSSPIDQFLPRVHSSNELQRSHDRSLNRTAIF